MKKQAGSPSGGIEQESGYVKRGIFEARRQLERINSFIVIEDSLEKYLDKRDADNDKHHFYHDMHILNATITGLLKTKEREGIGNHFQVGKPGEDVTDGKEEAAFPFATVKAVNDNIEKWSGKNVILEGEIRFMDKKKNGEHRHIFSDGTAMAAAFSKKPLVEGVGTLFSVAWQTEKGKQPFLEVKDFRPATETQET